MITVGDMNTLPHTYGAKRTILAKDPVVSNNLRTAGFRDFFSECSSQTAVLAQPAATKNGRTSRLASLNSE